jgi:predicted cobalt transporter CbtA
MTSCADLLTRAHLVYHPQPHTTLFLVMMRLNLKYVLVSLILMVSCVTLMLWSRCGDLVRTFPKRFYGEQKSYTS